MKEDKGSDARNFPFFQVDNALIDKFGPVIGPYGIAVYVAIARHLNRKSGVAFPSIRTLARETGMSVPRAQKSVNELSEQGLISIDRTKRNTLGNKVNLYELVDVAPLTPCLTTLNTPVLNEVKQPVFNEVEQNKTNPSNKTKDSPGAKAAPDAPRFAVGDRVALANDPDPYVAVFDTLDGDASMIDGVGEVKAVMEDKGLAVVLWPAARVIIPFGEIALAPAPPTPPAPESGDTRYLCWGCGVDTNAPGLMGAPSVTASGETAWLCYSCLAEGWRWDENGEPYPPGPPPDDDPPPDDPAPDPVPGGPPDGGAPAGGPDFYMGRIQQTEWPDLPCPDCGELIPLGEHEWHCPKDGAFPRCPQCGGPAHITRFGPGESRTYVCPSCGMVVWPPLPPAPDPVPSGPDDGGAPEGEGEPPDEAPAKAKRARASKTKPAKPAYWGDLMVAVMKEFNEPRGKASKIAEQLAGVAYQGDRAACNCDPPAKPEDIAPFIKHYRKEYPDLDLPTSAEALESHWHKFQCAKEARARAATGPVITTQFKAPDPNDYIRLGASA